MSPDIVCDVIPRGATGGVWDCKSLCVAVCGQVTVGLCVTELGTLHGCVQMTPWVSEPHHTQVTHSWCVLV